MTARGNKHSSGSSCNMETGNSSGSKTRTAGTTRPADGTSRRDISLATAATIIVMLTGASFTYPDDKTGASWNMTFLEAEPSMEQSDATDTQKQQTEEALLNCCYDGSPVKEVKAPMEQDEEEMGASSDIHHTGITLVNEGEVGSLTIPDGWQIEPRENLDQFPPVSTAVHPVEDASTRLVVHTPDQRFSPDIINEFQNVLTQKPHVLAESERATLAPVLGDLLNPEVFDMRAARTASLNGRQVLVVEGRFVEGGREYWGAYYPTQSSEVHSVFFSAPAPAFKQHRDTAMRAIRSISWRSCSPSNRATVDQQ